MGHTHHLVELKERLEPDPDVILTQVVVIHPVSTASTRE